MRALASYLILCFVSGYALAQNKAKVDSLQQVLKTHTANKEKAITYNLLADEYRKSDSAKVARYASLALDLSKKVNYPEGVANAYYSVAWITMIKGGYKKADQLFEKQLSVAKKADYKRGMADAYNGLGIVCSYQANYAKSLRNHQKSLEIRQFLKDTLGLTYSYNNIGIIYEYQGDYAHALEYYQKALKMKHTLGDKQSIAVNYNNIGGVYAAQKNYPKALKYFRKAQEIWETLHDKRISYIYINLGEVYDKQYQHSKALMYYKKALKLHQKSGDKRGQIYNHIHMGETYTTLNENQKALSHLQTAISIGEELGETSQLVRAMASIGKVYYQLKQYPRAIKYLSEGIALSRQTKSLEPLKNGAKTLAQVYRAMGNYKKAFDNQLLFQQLTDSLSSQEVIKKITRLETSFEYEKEKDSMNFARQKQQLAFDAEIKSHEVNQRTTYIGLGFALVFIIVLLFFYREKQNNNQRLNKANQNLEVSNIEVQAINAALKETLDIVKQQRDDILGSITYAKRIQKAVLPFEERMIAALPEHFVLYKPRDIVSGDFYWFEETDQKQFIIVADCTGHGVPGAFMTILGAQALTNIIGQNKVRVPGKILEVLNKTLQRILETDNTLVRDGMNIGVVVIDKANKKMQYAGAKSPLIMVQNGKVQQIKGDRYGINGDIRDNDLMQFTTHTIDITAPTAIYMYSDGYQDQFGGEEGKKFMKKRLRELLGKIADQPMVTQKQILETTLSKWMGKLDQVDDILVMGVRV